MRSCLVLVMALAVLLAIGVACGDDEGTGPAVPRPAGESDGEAEEWEGDGAEEGDGEGADANTDGDGVPDEDDDRPVVSASIDVNPSDYAGPCPVTLTFSGTITLESGSGTVLYQRVWSYGPPGPILTLAFDSPGTKDVGTSSMTTGESQSGWAAIKIYAPEELESDRANFTIDCDEEGPEDCPDADMDGVCDDDDDDDDDDGVSDADETDWGSDPLDAASTPESSDFDLGACHDGVDNDGDGFTDLDDDGCI